jgi:hypothetical protein
MKMMCVDNMWTTLSSLRSNPVDNSSILDRYLTASVRSAAVSERLKACCSRVRHNLTPLLCLLLGVIVTNTQTAQATNADQYKLYAHSRIVDFKQYQCFISIIDKENRSWDVNAVNGSHYGIGQMRSNHYRTLDGYRQIDATIKYAVKRYGSMCNAWAFHKRKNYF